MSKVYFEQRFVCQELVFIIGWFCLLMDMMLLGSKGSYCENGVRVWKWRFHLSPIRNCALVETRTDNNSSQLTTHTIDGRKFPEEKTKRYWSSVKLFTEDWRWKEETIDFLCEWPWTEKGSICKIPDNIRGHKKAVSQVKMVKSKAGPALTGGRRGAVLHWGLLSFGAGIFSERKRLMTSQHHIINWIPTNIFLSRKLFAVEIYQDIGLVCP